MTWLGLFLYSVLAATLLPGGSEAVFVGLLVAQPEHAVWLWVTATAGNTLGALITFAMGGLLARSRANEAPEWALKWPWLRFFLLSTKAVDQLHHHGPWLLLLSWVPLIGDGFCLAAGYLGWPKVRSFGLILLGKSARYGVLWYLVA
ncbi:MAG: DedA family protein [Oceanospirillaceae bacterium]|jgi:membrane protein YqaA with SNARE-associated domain|nr:DedA family protein [Oceanospirillaceae bacterium]MBT4441750.1 DedA family protein [Oceanospirillaceae bacterium]MBT6078368.1 DedA family protein [Oceanospirillaceae bacterium]MBT7331253.1 DedA family protein [Oceanospirillaceae bacterium]